jgi:hypothetical protein
MLLAAALLTFAASPAQAAEGDDTTGSPNGEGSVGYRERNVFAGFVEPPVEVVTPTRGGVFRPTHFCVHVPMSTGVLVVEHARGADLRAYVRTLTEVDFGGPTRVLVCFRAGDEVAYWAAVVTVGVGDPTAGQITTVESVARFAQRLVTVPVPSVRTSPPAGRLITGLETWFDTSVVEPPARSAQAGPLWATARAVPRRAEVVAEPGASPVVCPAAEMGVVRCTHTYIDVDARTGVRATEASVRVVYDIVLTTSDNPAPRVVDTITSDPAAIPVTISEIQTVLR